MSDPARAIAKLREAGDRLLTLEARIQELLARVAMLEQENGHPRSRLERITPADAAITPVVRQNLVHRLD